MYSQEARKEIWWENKCLYGVMLHRRMDGQTDRNLFVVVILFLVYLYTSYLPVTLDHFQIVFSLQVTGQLPLCSINKLTLWALHPT